MPVTDPVADFLTRIRNAIKARKISVEIPASNLKKDIAQILEEQKYIDGYEFVEDKKQGMLKIKLRYVAGKSAISGIKRISTPGLRNYADSKSIPRVNNGLGIAVISTSKGLRSDKQARNEKVGGEVICHVW
ncbi:MAG: 30S ribosomal protein S8 [Bacteroidetes bacterium]|nr:30S ribosomal protein S8 [Bacteroidota bacterium]MBU2584590.1 30S ribosomal protein S8 [Bacteroidota bacterium]